jgi:uncharacterized protein DUF397
MTDWRKSSYSFSNGNCIEVGAWRKSRRSADSGNCAEVAAWRKASFCASGECIEVGTGQAVIGVRDSADRDGPVLTFSAGEWERFTAALKAM